MTCHKILYQTFRNNDFTGYEVDHGTRVTDDARECTLRPGSKYMQKDNRVQGSNRDDGNYDSDDNVDE